MLAGIHQQADWLARGPRELLADARVRLGGDPPPRIYLTGCGDSHYAGLARAPGVRALERYPDAGAARARARPLRARARASACVGRVRVELRQGDAHGRGGDPGARAGHRPDRRHLRQRTACSRGAAEATIAYRYEDHGFGPGTISYVASLGALYAIAIRAGELSGRLRADGVEEKLRLIEAQADATRRTIELADPIAARLGHELPAGAKIDVVGGGPSFGTAFFGRAKLIESAHSPGRRARARGVGARGVLLHRPGYDDDRGRAAGRLGRPRGRAAHGGAARSARPRSPSPTPTARLRSPPTSSSPSSGDAPEELTPLTYCVPLELLAYHFASSKGLTMLGFDDERRRALNFRQIFSG